MSRNRASTFVLMLFAVLITSPVAAQRPSAPAQEEPKKEQTKSAEPGAGTLLPPPSPLATTPQPNAELPILTAPAPLAPPGFAGSRSDAIRIILGLFGLMWVAYLAGRPVVRDWERRLGIAHLVTAGLPLVLLGWIASRPAVDILSPGVLWELRPLLVLGLGWIGFSIGFRFDAQLVKSLWPGVGRVVASAVMWPFAMILVVCVAMLWAVREGTSIAMLIRESIILATSGATTSPSAANLLESRTLSAISAERIRTIVQLEELAVVFGLMLLSAYFRPTAFPGSWQLPGTAWLFMTIGMGATIGGIVYPILSRISQGSEFIVVMLGSISFAAGMASFLHLSPVVVCFIAGAILVNLPGGPKKQAAEALDHLERPIYFLFLIITGSLWHMEQWQGWALMAVFVAARLSGKWLGVVAFRARQTAALDPEEQKSLLWAPLGALSIAIVVSAEDLYFGTILSWIVTAVIGGAIVTEVIVQLTYRAGPAQAPSAPELA